MIHTKEPWEIRNGSAGPYITAKDDKGNHVAIAQVFPRGLAGCETKGNACLMKAAPKMAEALEDIIAQAEKTHLMLGPDLADSIRVFGKQALAEAKGEEAEDVFTMGNPK
jgi:hypothetical protein